MAGGPTPGKCDYRERHRLEVSIGLDHSLVIGFHHSGWALAFRDHINGSEHHRRLGTRARICSDDFRDVYLTLPPSVRRVEVKREPPSDSAGGGGPGGPGGGVVVSDRVGLWFEFGDDDSALRWHANSRLWFLTNKHHKLFMPLEWQHEAFDRHLRIETSLWPTRDDVVGPARGSRR